jgi:magnesium transporter
MMASSRPQTAPPKVPLAPAPDFSLYLMVYSPEGLQEQNLQDPAELLPHLAALPKTEGQVLWLNIDGTAPLALVETIGQMFYLHPLALEDVLHLQQRAKVDDYGDHLFMVARMMTPKTELETEQLSLFVGPNYVITFQERSGGDCLNPVRTRLRSNIDQSRRGGPARLTHNILDAIIDAYFPFLEGYGEYLEALEDQIASQPTQELVGKIYAAKRELLTLRRAIWPLRDVLTELRHKPMFAPQDLQFYLRDCYDHAVQVMDLIEVGRELCADLMDFYLSNVGHRTNQVMKVLTIISTIFMPLTFIAGVYGMNFNTELSPWNMPELNWYWGYPFSLGLMLLLVLGMLYGFRRLKWL